MGTDVFERGETVTYLEVTPQELRRDVKQSIGDHAELLRELLKTSAGHARQYLILTNAGAAVALMAFMGASEQVRRSPIAWMSLGFFFLGVIASGALAALDYHARKADFQLWLTDSDIFFANKMDIEELYERLNSRNKKIGYRPVIAGYAAFACFILGGVLSGGHFLLSSIHPMQGPYRVDGSAPWCELETGSKDLLCDSYSKQECKQFAVLPGSFCVPRTD